jgi:hypothetical protein
MINWAERRSDSSLHSAIMSNRPTNLGLVSSFQLCYGLPDFSAAVRALVDKVDLRHAPMGLDVSYVHRKSKAVGTND